jgi:hypothetical protein
MTKDDKIFRTIEPLIDLEGVGWQRNERMARGRYTSGIFKYNLNA